MKSKYSTQWDWIQCFVLRIKCNTHNKAIHIFTIFKIGNICIIIHYKRYGKWPNKVAFPNSSIKHSNAKWNIMWMFNINGYLNNSIHKIIIKYLYWWSVNNEHILKKSMVIDKNPLTYARLYGETAL